MLIGMSRSVSINAPAMRHHGKLTVSAKSLNAARVSRRFSEDLYERQCNCHRRCPALPTARTSRLSLAQAAWVQMIAGTAHHALRRGCPCVLELRPTWQALTLYSPQHAAQQAPGMLPEIKNAMSLQAFHLQHATSHALAFHTGPWRKSAAHAPSARSR